jgi:hypothetical protein
MYGMEAVNNSRYPSKNLLRLVCGFLPHLPCAVLESLDRGESAADVIPEPLGSIQQIA